MPRAKAEDCCCIYRAELGIWGLRFFSVVKKVTPGPFSPIKLFYLLARLSKITYPNSSLPKENAENCNFHYVNN